MMYLSQRARRRLLRHHLWIAAICALLLVGLQMAIESPNTVFRWSMATAYVGLGLLAATLAIGPIAVLRRRPNPLSIDLRRDIGIWCAVVSVAHVVVGLQVHMGSMVLYFFRVAEGGRAWFPRLDLFGMANHAGLLATMLVVLLLCLSNDRALRWLGRWRWKFWQRWSYALAVLVVLHGIAYQVMEKREAKFLIVFGLVVAAAATLQTLGFRRHRQRLTTGSPQEQV